MATQSNLFRQPMALVSWLAPYAKRVALRRRGLEMHAYDSGGDKPALLLVHGLADEADTWRHVFADLARDYRVIAPDLPGFGRSSKPRIDYTLDVFCDAVDDVLDALGVPGASLVGNSMGAMACQALALRNPQRVNRLVLVDGSLIITQRPGSLSEKIMAFLQLAPLVGEYWYTSLRRDPVAAYDTLHAYYTDLDGLPREDREFLFQRVNERVWDDAQRYAFFSTRRKTMAWFLAQTDLAAQVAASPVDTRAIWGEQDKILFVSNADALEALRPGLKTTRLPGVGHLPQQEAPDMFLGALRAALA